MVQLRLPGVPSARRGPHRAAAAAAAGAAGPGPTLCSGEGGDGADGLSLSPPGSPEDRCAKISRAQGGPQRFGFTAAESLGQHHAFSWYPKAVWQDLGLVCLNSPFVCLASCVCVYVSVAILAPAPEAFRQNPIPQRCSGKRYVARS